MSDKYIAKKSHVSWGVYNTKLRSWLYPDNLSKKQAERKAKECNRLNG
jgi:hypothetical protein